MTEKRLRAGNSQHVIDHVPVREPASAKTRSFKKKADEEAPRLHTPMHVSNAGLDIRSFRVVAELLDGSTTLICLGATRQDTLDHVHRLADDLPTELLRLRLEGWVGNAVTGTWKPLRTERGDLPVREPRKKPAKKLPERRRIAR